MKIVAYFLELCETHLRDDAPLLCMVDSCGSLRVINLRETLPSWREFTTADTLIYLVDTVMLFTPLICCTFSIVLFQRIEVLIRILLYLTLIRNYALSIISFSINQQGTISHLSVGVMHNILHFEFV